MSWSALDRELLRRTIALQVAQVHQDHSTIGQLLRQAEEIEGWMKRGC